MTVCDVTQGRGQMRYSPSRRGGGSQVVSHLSSEAWSAWGRPIAAVVYRLQVGASFGGRPATQNPPRILCGRGY